MEPLPSPKRLRLDQGQHVPAASDSDCIIVAVPERPKTSAQLAEEEDDDDIVIVKETTGEDALRDLPHCRPQCGTHPFRQEATAGNSRACAQCFCYVCDCRASECTFWGTGSSARDHCHAHSSSYWNALRKAAKRDNTALLQQEHSSTDSSLTVHWLQNSAKGSVGKPKSLDQLWARAGFTRTPRAGAAAAAAAAGKGQPAAGGAAAGSIPCPLLLKPKLEKLPTPASQQPEVVRSPELIGVQTQQQKQQEHQQHQHQQQQQALEDITNFGGRAAAEPAAPLAAGATAAATAAQATMPAAVGPDVNQLLLPYTAAAAAAQAALAAGDDTAAAAQAALEAAAAAAHAVFPAASGDDGAATALFLAVAPAALAAAHATPAPAVLPIAPIAAEAAGAPAVLPTAAITAQAAAAPALLPAAAALITPSAAAAPAAAAAAVHETVHVKAAAGTKPTRKRRAHAHGRTPRCGSCDTCRNPSWKQACRVNRQRIMQGLPPVLQGAQ